MKVIKNEAMGKGSDYVLWTLFFPSFYRFCSGVALSMPNRFGTFFLQQTIAKGSLSVFVAIRKRFEFDWFYIDCRRINFEKVHQVGQLIWRWNWHKERELLYEPYKTSEYRSFVKQFIRPSHHSEPTNFNRHKIYFPTTKWTKTQQQQQYQTSQSLFHHYTAHRAKKMKTKGFFIAVSWRRASSTSCKAHANRLLHLLDGKKWLESSTIISLLFIFAYRILKEEQ